MRAENAAVAVQDAGDYGSGGAYARQPLQQADKSQERAGMRRDGAGSGLLGRGDGKWRRVRARSMSGGLRRGNACRQGFRRQIQAGKAGRASATA